jgi:cell division protein FtsW
MYVRAVSSTTSSGHQNDRAADPEQAAGPKATAGAAGPEADALAGVRERTRAFRELVARPLTPYYLIIGITALLLCLGLVMVLSTASVMDLEYGKSPYSDFARQLIGVVIGVPLMWLAARASPRLFRAAAYPLVAVAILGLLLTLIHGVGAAENGATRWIQIGSFQFQPSEIAKLALAIWGADLLARKERLGLLKDWRHMLVPLLPGTAILALLVMVGDDLGTTSILLVIFLTLLWIAGTPSRVFAGMLILMGLVGTLLIMTAGYRAARITDFFSATANANPLGTNMQSIQGRYALGSGGVFGVGVGSGGGKWGWVPEDTTDFIFAIIGEEFGLVGTLCVTALYGALAYAGLRVARTAPDMFGRLVSAAITAWIVLEAVINIGAVIGVIPITGVPLPLVSYGLSSLLVTMVALGILLSFARRAPGAEEALAARGPGVASRLLSWGGPLRRND